MLEETKDYDQSILSSENLHSQTPDEETKEIFSVVENIILYESVDCVGF